MVAKINNIVRMSNHLQNQEQYQQQRLKHELEHEKHEFVDSIENEISKIDMKI